MFTFKNRFINQKKEIIDNFLRNRLFCELQFIVESNKYLEKFLIVENRENDTFYLHTGTLTSLSLRELGYNIGDYFDLRNIKFATEQVMVQRT